MILSDVDIKKELFAGNLVINPPIPNDNIGSCSIDLRLSNEFFVFKHVSVVGLELMQTNMNPEEFMERVIIDIDAGSFILHPGEFALGSTIEYIQIPNNLVGRIDGRSSLGRLGLIIHGTASTFDPGFQGNATLELSNIGKIPLILRPDMRICAFVFEELKTPTSMPYYQKPGAKYSGQIGPVVSRINKDKYMKEC